MKESRKYTRLLLELTAEITYEVIHSQLMGLGLKSNSIQLTALKPIITSRI